MGKPSPLKIIIDKPCQQDWQDMEVTGKGRHCQQCQKTVIDFTGLTDDALYQYFKTSATSSCGRFYREQLNRSILPTKRKPFYWKNIYKAAATLFAFLGMKYAGATTSSKNATPFSIAPVSLKLKTAAPPEKIMISGIVKDAYGAGLDSASILFADKVMTTTGKDGKFEFEIDLVSYDAGKPLFLMVTCPGFNNVVRSYHPAMLSTSYDIIMSPPLAMRQMIMGGIGPVETISLSAAFLIRPGKKILTDDLKKELADIASLMRDNPELVVDILAYPEKTTEKAERKKVQTAIKQYMAKEEGISEGRFILLFEKYIPDLKNVIEIKPAEEEGCVK